MVDQRLGTRNLVKEIADDLMIRPEVVHAVIARFIDIAMEEMVNNLSFPVRGIVSIVPYRVKGGSLGVNGEVTRPQTRYRAKFSKGLLTLIRLQQNNYADSPYFVNRDNWRGALKWALQNRSALSENENTDDNLNEVSESLADSSESNVQGQKRSLPNIESNSDMDFFDMFADDEE